MDKRLEVEFPEIEFNTNDIMIKAEKIIEKKRKRDQSIFLVIIIFLGIVLFQSFVNYQNYYIIIQIVILFVISPVVLLINYMNSGFVKGHHHEY